MSRRPGNFRGSSAAASLKRERGPGPVAHAREFPRLFGRGLIEAGSRPRLRPTLSRFPRLFGRGLIEAPERSAVTWKPRHFRGSSAAASLKPPSTEVSKMFNYYFRGSSAAASLKPTSPTGSGGASMPISAALRPRPH